MCAPQPTFTAAVDAFTAAHSGHSSDAWWDGRTRAYELLTEVEVLRGDDFTRQLCASLLTVEPDPTDDPDYDAGFRSALRASL